MLTQDEVRELFLQRFHCSQIVFGEWAEELGLDKDTAVRLAAPLGAGMFCGATCGAVSGALLVIGARYGACLPNDKERDRAMRDKVKEFQRRFSERFGSTLCRELLHRDFSQPGEYARAGRSGVMMEACPGLVTGALEILDDIMKEGEPA